MPRLSDNAFKSYGEDNVEILANHCFSNSIQGEKLKTQWQGIKYHIAYVLKASMPSEVKSGTSPHTPTEWLLIELLKNAGLCHFFPEVVFIAEVPTSLPVSNAWPERGDSSLKIIKTKQRN